MFAKSTVSEVLSSNGLLNIAASVRGGIRRAVQDPLALNAIPIAGASYGGLAIGFLTSVVSARILGPTEFGLVAIITSYPTLLGYLLGVKSSSITTRYIANFRATGRASELLSICKFGYALDLSAALLTLLLVALTGWWVAGHLYHVADAGWLMVAYAMSFLSWPLVGTSVAILSSFERFGWLAGLHFLGKTIECVIVIGLLLAGFGVAGFILGITASRILNGIVALMVAARALHSENLGSWWRAPLSGVTPLRKELAGFFSWNYIEITFAGLLEHLPLMLLGYLRGPADAGFYRLARSMAEACSYLEASMGKVAYPILSSLSATTGLDEINAQLRRWTLTGGLSAGAVVLLSIPLLPFLIPAVFGGHYSPMATGAQIMMVTSALSAMFFWTNSLYYASGNVAFWTKGCVLQTVPVIGLAWFAIDQWGYIGMATLATIGKVFFTLYMAVASRQVTEAGFKKAIQHRAWRV